MAEMLVRVSDKTHLDLAIDAAQEKRGHVVVVRPDGWPWSEAERGHPEWLVVRAPDLSESAASVFTAPGRVMPDAGLIPPARAFALDLDHPDWSPGGGDLLRFKVICPATPDPRFLGIDRHTIG